jgi:hypothetical protein
MIQEAQKRVGKKKYTIKSITDDLYNGAWNNLDLSKSSKRALLTAGLIISLGALSAYHSINKK